MGLFLPESSIPGTEEIIAFVERKILFPNVPCLFPGPGASPRPPGSAGPHVLWESGLSWDEGSEEGTGL